jgi:hypothetical protein
MLCAGVNEALIEEIKKGNAKYNCPKCPPGFNDTLEIIEGQDNFIDNEPAMMGKVIDNGTPIESSTPNADKAKVKEHSEIEKAIDDISAFDFSKTTLESIATLLKGLTIVVLDIRRSQQYFSETYDKILKTNEAIITENKQLKDRIVKIEDKNQILQDKLYRIESSIDEPKRELIKNNIVLAGLPNNLANPLDVVMKIAKKINSNLKKNDIADIQRIEPKNYQQILIQRTF